MKVLPELYPSDLDSPPANQIELPQGLVGFANYKRAELLYLPDHLPFLWMKLHSDADDLHFIVIEPGGIVPGYEPEIFDADAEHLDLRTPAEAMILNIVTLPPPESGGGDRQSHRAPRREPPHPDRPSARDLELLALQREPLPGRKPAGARVRPHSLTRHACSLPPGQRGHRHR